ncbi:MAG TPA: exo-alpha-sialidase, partial [Thermoanaerobaculia bacterium]|nr:exo-alpha-sialidase [Thermoanaerobaculia bacterium]
PNLALDGPDLLLTWLEPRAAPAGERAHALRFARLRGDRWSAPVTVAAGTGFFANWADFPAAVRGRRGLVAHWLGMLGPGTYAYGVQLARSADGGATWRRVGLLHDDSSPTEHGFVSYVAEGEGVRAFWLDGRQTAGGHGGDDGEAEEGPMSLRTAAVGAAAAAASELLDPLVCSCCQTDAAMAAEGPVVVYRDRSAGEVRDVAIVRRTRAGWSAPAAVAADGWRIPGCPVNGPAVAASGSRVAVAWFTAAAPGPRVRAALSADGGARFGAPIEIDAAQPLGRVDLAMTPGGEAVVSWLALESGEAGEAGGERQARVRLRRLSPDGAGAPFSVAATGAARSSGFPRLALQGDRLVLTWVEDGEPSRLRAAALPLAALPAVR